MNIDEVLKTYDKINVFNISLPGAGFGAVLLTTLNQFRYCERNNYYPVINYDHTCDNAFFDEKYGNNLWEQYFELPMSISYEDVREALEKDIISQDDCVGLPDKEVLSISEEHPESIYPFPFGKWRKENLGDLDEWYAFQRIKGRETMQQYVTLKPHIKNKVKEFCHKHFSDSFTLGVHIRGTDLHYAPVVSPAEYFPHIDLYLEKEPELKIFLATDQAQYVPVFEERYGSRVIYSDCFRSDNAIAPFARQEISPYQKGEDVLLDMLLLSHCDFLIKGSSNVGEMALYFNPRLECLDLAYKKTKAFGQDYGAGWDNLSNLPAWKLVGKNELDQVADDVNSQNSVQSAQYGMRKIVRRLMKFLGDMKRAIFQ